MKSSPYWISLLLILLFACNNDKTSEPPVEDDTISPARVQDLAVNNSGVLVILGWTAPGDDGAEGRASQYDIRYSRQQLTEVEWDSAMVAESPPTPRSAGQTESFVVSGLASGTWYFGIKAADEVLNWSALSNVISANVTDTNLPGRVTDLAAISPTQNSVTLAWTAPGGDGDDGQASEYDLRYSLESITFEIWDDAIQVQGMPVPGSAGSAETFTVTGLEPVTTYFFALRSADETPNWSELSNVASEETSVQTRFRLTSSTRSSGASGPDWSPDGQSIVFNADWRSDERIQLYLVPAGGGAPVLLTDIPEGAAAATWSPDGNKLAFISLRRENDDTLAELSVMDATPGSEPVLLASHGLQTVRAHTWSPDGSQIAYTVLTSMFPVPTNDMYVVSSSGGSSTLLNGGFSIIGLDWSPDGSQIVFASNQAGSNDIWVMPASGGEAVQLTDDTASDSFPAWSPDGSQIAFSSNRSGNTEIWVMSPTGENPTQLTVDPGDERGVSWSPDGSQICFGSRGSDGISDIWVLSLR